MPLKDRRAEYSWQPTQLSDVQLLTDKRSYSSDESITATLGFRVVGGLREAFHPDVWTVAWEDYDKYIRLTMHATLFARRTIHSAKLAEIKKEVRKASFYWSRDPDLPYRIWAMILPEDGGAPIIPVNVEDAKSRMFDFIKPFKIHASSLGVGTHKLTGRAEVKWSRRSFIERGRVVGLSQPAVVEIE